MTDYTPVYVPGRVITLTASAAVSGGDLLVVSGSGTVAKLAFAASPQQIVGVAESDTPVNGRVTVFARGIVHESVAQGTVTAGQLITTPVTGDTAGAQVKAFAVSALANQDVTVSPTQTTINTAINAVVAALNGASGAGSCIFGIALTTASNPAKVRWMEI